MKGKQVESVEELATLSSQKRAVTVTARGWHGRQGYTPAVWLLNCSASCVYRLIEHGRVFVYERETSAKTNQDDLPSTQTTVE